MFSLGITPTVFATEGPERLMQQGSVFKYDVTGLNNRDFVQYQIMHNGKNKLWCVHDCLGTITMSGYETAEQALQALEERLNKEYGFTTTTIN